MDRAKRIKKYQVFIAQEKAEKLEENKELIDSFIAHCKNYGVELQSSDFDYNHALGVHCRSKDIVLRINPRIVSDKEGLYNFKGLLDTYSMNPFFEGAFYADKYIFYASSFFRRGFYGNNNFAPLFMDHFCKHDFNANEVGIALDLDRVRIDTEDFFMIERDTWYGGKFSEDIGSIKDGVIHLRPPQYLDDIELELFYADAFALDVYWYSYENIKVFQVLEFKQSNVTIKIDKKMYFPVRYLHAEYDMDLKHFRHFDGALQFYTEEEYYERRVNNFNSKVKGEYQVKSTSKKLFKINGELNVEDWIMFTSHFFAKNPLILEYFEGEEPDYLKPTLEAIKKDRQIV
ncbi:MAG: hypothetical protein AB3N14_02465 [Flavobacteriaceae bacterium]